MGWRDPAGRGWFATADAQGRCTTGTARFDSRCVTGPRLFYRWTTTTASTRAWRALPGNARQGHAGLACAGALHLRKFAGSPACAGADRLAAEGRALHQALFEIADLAGSVSRCRRCCVGSSRVRAAMYAETATRGVRNIRQSSASVLADRHDPFVPNRPLDTVARGPPHLTWLAAHGERCVGFGRDSRPARVDATRHTALDREDGWACHDARSGRMRDGCRATIGPRNNSDEDRALLASFAQHLYALDRRRDRDTWSVASRSPRPSRNHRELRRIVSASARTAHARCSASPNCDTTDSLNSSTPRSTTWSARFVRASLHALVSGQGDLLDFAYRSTNATSSRRAQVGPGDRIRAAPAPPRAADPPRIAERSRRRGPQLRLVSHCWLGVRFPRRRGGWVVAVQAIHRRSCQRARQDC